MPVNAYVAVDTFTTVINGERRWARRGRSYPDDDPLVIARPTLFRPVAAFNPDKVEAEPKAELKPKRTYRRRKG